MTRQPFAHQDATDVFAQADAAGHRWFVLETATGRILFTDHTCRGARSWAAHVAGAPTWRVRAGLYGVGSRTGSLTITTRDEAQRRQRPTGHTSED